MLQGVYDDDDDDEDYAMYHCTVYVPHSCI